jgi:hypothetical protein
LLAAVIEVSPSANSARRIVATLNELSRARSSALFCGRAPSDPHHIKFAEQRAMGRKVSDRFTVPICRLRHRELHRRGNERAWWESQAIDPLPVAANLWAKTHEFASAAANIDGAQRTESNGRGLINGSSLVG